MSAPSPVIVLLVPIWLLISLTNFCTSSRCTNAVRSCMFMPKNFFLTSIMMFSFLSSFFSSTGSSTFSACFASSSSSSLSSPRISSSSSFFFVSCSVLSVSNSVIIPSTASRCSSLSISSMAASSSALLDSNFSSSFTSVSRALRLLSISFFSISALNAIFSTFPGALPLNARSRVL